MRKFLIDADGLTRILEKTIDLFLEYQYKHGYDEPRARSEAVMAVIESLKRADESPGGSE